MLIVGRGTDMWIVTKMLVISKALGNPKEEEFAGKSWESIEERTAEGKHVHLLKSSASHPRAQTITSHDLSNNLRPQNLGFYLRQFWKSQCHWYSLRHRSRLWLSFCPEVVQAPPECFSPALPGSAAGCTCQGNHRGLPQLWAPLPAWAMQEKGRDRW